MKATQLLHNLWPESPARQHHTRFAQQRYLKRHIDELSVTGLTSNPTIFDRAIKNGTAYDSANRKKLDEGKSGEDLFFELALEDLTRAADLFRPIYDRTDGVDGWVSLEVSPLLGHDTARTISAAKSLTRWDVPLERCVHPDNERGTPHSDQTPTFRLPHGR